MADGEKNRGELRVTGSGLRFAQEIEDREGCSRGLMAAR
jgi:hypothetical protein